MPSDIHHLQSKMPETDTRQFQLVYPDDPQRVIRVRVEGPRGFAESRKLLPHVIVVHGFKGFMDWGFFPEISRRIAEAGMIAVRFNMSGSGIGPDLQNFTDLEGFTRNTYTRELEDLDHVRSWAESGNLRGIDPGRVALLGHSRGGGIALLHGAERGGCRSIVTWAAIPEVDRFDDDTKLAWRELGFLPVRNARTNQEFKIDVAALDDMEKNRTRLDIVAACRRLALPVLLIHGAADETVNVEAIAQLSAALDPELTRTLIIAGAGHTFGATHPMRSVPEPFERAAEATIAMLLTHWPG
jgi:dienelactone hydrolase